MRPALPSPLRTLSQRRTAPHPSASAPLPPAKDTAADVGEGSGTAPRASLRTTTPPRARCHSGQGTANPRHLNGYTPDPRHPSALVGPAWSPPSALVKGLDSGPSDNPPPKARLNRDGPKAAHGPVQSPKPRPARPMHRAANATQSHRLSQPDRPQPPQSYPPQVLHAPSSTKAHGSCSQMQSPLHPQNQARPPTRLHPAASPFQTPSTPTPRDLPTQSPLHRKTKTIPPTKPVP